MELARPEASATHCSRRAAGAGAGIPVDDERGRKTRARTIEEWRRLVEVREQRRARLLGNGIDARGIVLVIDADRKRGAPPQIGDHRRRDVEAKEVDGRGLLLV